MELISASLPPWLPEALLLTAVAFGPLAFGAVEPWSLAILETLIFSMLAVVILRGPAAEARPRPNAVFWAAAAIAVLGLLQWLNFRPLTEPGTLLPFTAAAYRTGQAVILWSAYAALLWCAPQMLDGRPALRRLA